MAFADQLTDTSPGQTFVPGAQYYPAMDCLLYLEEDVSYRADRVDEFLTLLWQPYSLRLVGLKLKGFHARFESLTESVDLDEGHFLKLIDVVTFFLIQGGAREIMEGHESERKKKLLGKYKKAIDFAIRAEYPLRLEDFDLAA